MHSCAKVIVHIVFSTKYRSNLIPQNVIDNLHAYLAVCCRNRGCEPFRVGGTENHVHIACALSRTVTIAQLVEEIKRTSSIWMKQFKSNFGWQTGYGIFSISQSHFDKLIHYVATQAEHHGMISYEMELTDLCERYGLEYIETEY